MPDGQDNPTRDATELRLIEWLEKNVGGSVTSLERQKRWRPAWYADMRTAKGPVALYVRGDRTSKSIPAPFEQEFKIMQVLERNALPVPHMYGMCPNPLSIVMERMPGRPDLSTADNDDDRRAVLDQYVNELVRMQAIDPRQFEAIGVMYPRTPEEIGLNQFERFEGMYRAGKSPRPEPTLEFIVRWVKRNVPTYRDRVVFVHGDPAQFIFDKNKMTALLDFEMAHLGDPLEDLAGFQLRDTAEPLGDLGRAMRQYEKVSGTPIDAATFDFHTIQFAAQTPLSMVESLTKPLAIGSVLQYLEWYLHFLRVPLELMAARLNVPLPPVEPLVSRPVWLGAMSQGLVNAIRAIPTADAFAAFEKESTARLADYFRRAGEYGPAIEKADLAETEALLNAKFDNWLEADTALEKFVLTAGAEHDQRLVLLFYRRVQRQIELHAPFISRLDATKRLKTFAQLMGR
jgi:aminoglycoside phosphotransferase (APT) family kinase protein